MIEFILLLILLLALSHLTDIYNRKQYSGYSIFFLMLTIFVLSVFIGTRTKYNDTERYIIKFEQIPSYLDYLLTIKERSYPGFELILWLIRQVSSDSAVMLLITSSIVQISFALFLYKHSRSLCQSIFFYLVSGLYLFTGTAIKQALAMSVAVWSVPMIAEGRKAAPALLVLLSMTIHPYAVVLAITPLLMSEPYSKRMNVIILATIVITIGFSSLLPYIEQFIRMLGSKYTIEEIIGGVGVYVQGVNPLRWAIYLVTPILVIKNLNRIRSADDMFLFCASNASVVSAGFMTVALVANPQFFGRIADFFLPYTICVLSYIMYEIYNTKGIHLIRFSVVSMYVIYFLYSLYIINNDIFASILGHY